ncbi:MAG: zinc ribbon domain-containing protein [Clostridia bacterium]|nr:zinc ribbon domain-containing protein [Clostridia bacterium]
MYCKHCGAQLPDGSKFCSKCGKSLVDQAAQAVAGTAAQPAENPYVQQAQPAQHQTPAKENNPKKGKKVLIAVIVAVLAVALLAGAIALIASLIGKKSGGNFTVSDKKTYMLGADGDTLWIFNSGKLTEAVKGELYSSSDYKVAFDAAKEKAAVLVTLKGGTYKLLYFDGKNVTEVASADDDVFDDEILISSNGEGIAYTFYDENNDPHVYWFNGKKAEKIAEYAYATAISPDGKTVCYRKYSKVDGSYTSDYRGCYYTGGKEYVIGTNCTAFGVADGAKFVYFFREADDGSYIVYVQKKDNEDTRVKVGTSDDYVDGCAFNSDYTQAFYQIENKGTYLVKNGEEPVKLTSKAISPLLTNNTVYTSDDKADMDYMSIGIKDFEDPNLLWEILDGGYTTRIMKLTSSGTETVISGDELYHVVLCDDFRTVIYAKDGKLLSFDTGAKNPEPVELLDLSEYSDWNTTNDGRVVFYADSFNDIYAKKGTGKAVKVFEGNEKVNSSVVFFQNKLFFVYENELYVSDGGKAEKVSGAGNEVKSLMTYGSTFFLQNEEGDLFCSGDGKTFTKFYEN